MSFASSYKRFASLGQASDLAGHPLLVTRCASAMNNLSTEGDARCFNLSPKLNWSSTVGDHYSAVKFRHRLARFDGVSDVERISDKRV